MGGEAVGWVFRHSPLTGQAFTVHLAIADVVNDANDNKFWMTVPNLAAKARCTRDSARKALRTMESHHPPLIERLTEKHGQPTEYRFLTPPDPHPFRSAPPSDPPPTPPDPRSLTPPDPRQSLSGLTQEELNPPALPGMAPPATPADPPPDPLAIRARAVAVSVWEGRKPRPTVKFIALIKMAERFLDAGNDDVSLTRAMIDTASFTDNAVEFQLSKTRGAPPGTQPGIITDRTTPARRVQL